MYKTITLIIFFLAITLPIIKAEDNGKKYLVVIALDKYENRLSLTDKVKNAKELKDILYTKYNIEKVYELFDFLATKENILNLFIDIEKSLKPEDSLIIYFSGHGFIDSSNKAGYWIPYNAGINESEKFNWIPVSDLLNPIYKLDLSKLLLIVDSAFPDELLDRIEISVEKSSDIETLKKSNLKAREAIGTGLQETTIIKNNFSDNILNFFKTNKEKYFTSDSLYAFLKNNFSFSSIFKANLKNSGYAENSLFYLTVRDKPLEIKKEEPKIEEKPEEPKKIDIPVKEEPDQKKEKLPVKEPEKKDTIKSIIDPQVKLINAYNKAGFILLPFAASILTAGAFIFTVDMFVVNKDLQDKIDNPENSDYSSYVETYKLNMTLFCTGIGLLATGVTMFATAIPLAVYKPKSPKITFNFGIDKGLNFNLKYNF